MVSDIWTDLRPIDIYSLMSIKKPMANDKPLKDVRFKIPEDVDVAIKNSGKSYRDIILEYMGQPQQEVAIPEFLFNPDTVNQLTIYRYIKSLENNDYNKKIVRYLYNRITELIAKNGQDGISKLDDLRNFIFLDMISSDSPFMLPIVKEALEPVVELKEKIYSDNGLIGDKNRIESEIAELEIRRDALKEENDKLQASINDLNAVKDGIAAEIEQLNAKENEVKAGIDESVKEIAEENARLKDQMSDYEKMKSDVANLSAALVQLKDAINQRDADIKKYKELYTAASNNYANLVNKMSTKEFEKINSREITKK
ncbi:MAG: coiled-coil domain-containing protein [Thermoplasmata archaeon]